ncbi:hypothetical protein KA082_02460, partial [Candidatus Woesebacteria bacterium]|nr:hypothetical protein [Candidatus Woesebacteria bacterium]
MPVRESERSIGKTGVQGEGGDETLWNFVIDLLADRPETLSIKEIYSAEWLQQFADSTLFSIRYNQLAGLLKEKKIAPPTDAQAL